MLNKCNRFGRNPVVLLGLITHFVAFYLIFLNIASDAPIAPEAGTNLQGYITPRYQNHRGSACFISLTGLTSVAFYLLLSVSFKKEQLIGNVKIQSSFSSSCWLMKG